MWACEAGTVRVCGACRPLLVDSRIAKKEFFSICVFRDSPKPMQMALNVESDEGGLRGAIDVRIVANDN